MELTIEKSRRDCRYIQDTREYAPFVIRESSGIDYSSTVVLLRNLVEKKDTTPLEREALSSAVRLIRQSMNTKK